MTETRFDFPSFILGVCACLFGIILLAWLYEYGQSFFEQHKEMILGLILGGTLVYCINKIDWEAGF